MSAPPDWRPTVYAFNFGLDGEMKGLMVAELRSLWLFGFPRIGPLDGPSEFDISLF